MTPFHDRSVLALIAAPVLVGALAGCTATAAPSRSTEPSTAAAREITLDPYLGRLRTVDVTVAGGTLPFLFDTAGGVALLTVEAAERAGCEPFGRGVGFRHDGSPVALSRCRGVELTIGGVPTADEEVGVWDLMAVLGGAPEVGGLVSLKSFEGDAITLDLAAGEQAGIAARRRRQLDAHGKNIIRIRLRRLRGWHGRLDRRPDGRSLRRSAHSVPGAGIRLDFPDCQRESGVQ